MTSKSPSGNPPLDISPIRPADHGWIVALLTERWGSTRIDTRERLLDAGELPGFVARRAGERTGLLTWHREGDAFEVVTLDAVTPGAGVGAALMQEAIAHAASLGCARLWLTTSNDNFRAQRLYQRLGLRLVAVHEDAITRARTRKPGIPLVSPEGIPIRDEWEYELRLGGDPAGRHRSLAAPFVENPGSIDIYLFDQILKGRFEGRHSLLDVGCAGGRNLVPFLRAGLDVCGVDQDSEAIAQARRRASQLAPDLPGNNFQVAAAEALPHPDSRFDAVVCIALLHFAADEKHFLELLAELWRVLRPGGLFFARLASSIGLSGLGPPLSERRYRLPDGTDRFLVDEPFLLEHTARLGGVLLDPLKTTNVQGLRCMTTWVVRKQDQEIRVSTPGPGC